MVLAHLGLHGGVQDVGLGLARGPVANPRADEGFVIVPIVEAVFQLERVDLQVQLEAGKFRLLGEPHLDKFLGHVVGHLNGKMNAL